MLHDINLMWLTIFELSHVPSLMYDMSIYPLNWLDAIHLIVEFYRVDREYAIRQVTQTHNNNNNNHSLT
jgi:hypothetical protein